jgi:hypothetical protein
VRGGQVRYNELASLAEARSLTTGCEPSCSARPDDHLRVDPLSTGFENDTSHTPRIGATRRGAARETVREAAVVGGGEEPTGYAPLGGGDNAQPRLEKRVPYCS